MRRRFYLTFNAHAGAANRAALETVLARLRAAGATVAAAEAGSAEDCRRQVAEAARSGQFDCVIAAGGDGTARQAAAGLDGLDVPLGFIPLGTGNVLAHETGIGLRAGAVARTLLGGDAVPIRGATANGEPFLLMCGAGFDGRVIAGLDHAAKSRFGKLAYARPLLGALAHRTDALEVEADGVMHYAAWAIVSNARCYGGGFVLTRRTHVAAAGVQLILFKSESRVGLARQLVALAAGRLDARAERNADVIMLACRRVRIAGGEPVPLQIDGDAFGTTPVTIEADAGPRVRLLVPGRQHVRDGGG